MIILSLMILKLNISDNYNFWSNSERRAYLWSDNIEATRTHNDKGEIAVGLIHIPSLSFDQWLNRICFDDIGDNRLVIRSKLLWWNFNLFKVSIPTQSLIFLVNLKWPHLGWTWLEGAFLIEEWWSFTMNRLAFEISVRFLKQR